LQIGPVTPPETPIHEAATERRSLIPSSAPAEAHKAFSKKFYRKTINFICFSAFHSYICRVKQQQTAMEPEKVIRIVSLFLLIVAFALHVATRLMFPDASDRTLSIIVLCLLAISSAIADRRPQRRSGRNER
jgi:hypothetical protein